MIAPVASIVPKLSSSVFIKSPGSSAGVLFRAIGVILYGNQALKISFLAHITFRLTTQLKTYLLTTRNNVYERQKGNRILLN